MTTKQILKRLKRMLQRGGVEENYAREEITSLIKDIEKEEKCLVCENGTRNCYQHNKIAD